MADRYETIVAKLWAKAYPASKLDKLWEGDKVLFDGTIEALKKAEQRGIARAVERLEILAGSPLCPSEHEPVLRMAAESIRKLVPGG